MFGGKQRFRLLFERAVGFTAGQKRLLERLVARLTEHVVNRAERHLHARAAFQKQCLCIVVHV